MKVERKPEVNWRNKGFPKNIGIVFLAEKRENGTRRFGRKSSRLRLDFDQTACAYLLLQMNGIQNLFNFQIVDPPGFISTVELFRGEFSIWWPGAKRFFTAHKRKGCLFTANNREETDNAKFTKDEYIVQWFDDVIINKLEDNPYTKVDYYIGITSEGIGQNLFLRTRGKETSHNGRIFSIITSELWERGSWRWEHGRLRRSKPFSPPSVFEYIAVSVFACSLRSVGTDISGKSEYVKDEFLGHYATRGCIFDYTGYKRYRRIPISNPAICSYCKKDLQQLELIIRQETEDDITLCDSVNKVLAREWMGSVEKWGSPIYNLKRNYKYNVDRNSGFTKKWHEIVRDSFIDNIAPWVLGIAGGILSALLVAFHLFPAGR